MIVGKTEKMSKSLKNVVDPDYLIRQYGADTARLFCLFAAPPERDLEWSDQGVEGSFRFLHRTWRIVADYLDDLAGVAPVATGDAVPEDLRALRRKTHQTIKKVSGDIEDRFHFNTAISAIMELVNALYQTPRPAPEDRAALAVIRETIETVLTLLAPFVPHVAEELWQLLGHGQPLVDRSWPAYDPAVASAEEITIVVQVNGKLRGRITVPADEEEEAIRARARADEKVGRFLAGKRVVKEIYVPGRLFNIVVA